MIERIPSAADGSSFCAHGLGKSTKCETKNLATGTKSRPRAKNSEENCPNRAQRLDPLQPQQGTRAGVQKIIFFIEDSNKITINLRMSPPSLIHLIIGIQIYSWLTPNLGKTK
jgi:hypothetical protein